MNKVFPILMLSLGFVVGTSVTVAYAAGGIDMLADVFIDGTLTVQDGTQGAGKVFTSDGSGTGSWQTSPDTNAGTICSSGEFLNGDGTCDPVPAGSIDTNAGTICAAGQYLDGDGTCKGPRYTQCDVNTDGGIDTAEFLYWLLMNGVTGETIDSLTTPTDLVDDIEAGATSSNFNGVVDTTDELAHANFILTIVDSSFPICKVF